MDRHESNIAAEAAQAAGKDRFASLMDGLTLTAPSLIVTIYGDIAVPRGGVLWMGTLIDICAGFGISETQVRTAVSRLVTAGRLTGIRNGRRSFYELADTAKAEFDMAARLLYEPLAPPQGWLILRAPDDKGDETPRDQHFGYLGSHLHIRPDHGHLPVPTGMSFRGDLVSGACDMATLAASLWPLDAYAARYRDVIDRFAAIASEPEIDVTSALHTRLLLVHLYRRALLADPLLPPSVLPEDWPGPACRRLFVKLYRKLLPGTDRLIALRFEGFSGPLPEATEQTRQRAERLATFE